MADTPSIPQDKLDRMVINAARGRPQEPPANDYEAQAQRDIIADVERIRKIPGAMIDLPIDP